MTEFMHPAQPRPRPRKLARRWEGSCARILAGFRRLRVKRRTRRRLADLEAHMLRDIGVTPGEAMREVRVSFPWRLSFPWRDDRRPPGDAWR